MPDAAAPRSIEELAAMVRDAVARRHTVETGGGFSKRAMGGPAARPAEAVITTAAMNRVLEYEPNDLTVSVEAGMKWADLQSLLAAHNQMVPLDPPCYAGATVGGVLAANTCGPRRRLYGGVRDAVIGMRFITADGRIIRSGGMVVKNVAGLDMGKLLIGSFGTLGVIAEANFKLTPVPPCSATFLLRCASLDDTIAHRNRVLTGVLQPSAIDILCAAAGGQWTLALRAGGTETVIARYRRELPAAEVIEGHAEGEFWAGVREFPASAAACVRASTELAGVAAVLRAAQSPAIARAGNGVVYTQFSDPDAAARWAAALPCPALVEWAPPESGIERWPRPGSDLAVMRNIKKLLDPLGLLNPGRLYGRI